MLNNIKKGIIIGFALTLTIFISIQVKALMTTDNHSTIQFTYEPPLFGNNLYMSNRYTQPDQFIQVGGDNTIPDEYELLSQNSNSLLYLNRETFEFKIKNLESGYVWNSSGQNLKEGGLNATNREIMRSPVYIEYYPYIEKTGELISTIKRASAYDAKITYENIENGIIAHLNYKKLDIAFDLKVILEPEGLVVSIDNDSITELNNKIASIYLFPNFGSTYSDTVPGYMFIPDGTGALYRFKDNSNIKNMLQFTTRFFGYDIGLSNTNTKEQLSNTSMPVYGMVHGINQNAFLAVIEEGLYNAALNINPSGANGINYNWLGTKFIFREMYVYPTNLKGDGITVIQEEKNDENLKIRLLFTNQTASNYVGMAQLYQDYLVNKGILSKHTVTETNLRLEILATDSEKGLFGPKTLKMTNIEESEAIIDDLYEQGLEDMLVVLRGWNKGGMSGETPYEIKYERKFASEDEVKKLSNKLEEKGINLYFYNDYIKAYETSNVVNPRTDFARGIYKRRIENHIYGQMYDTYYYLNPTTILDLGKKDLKAYDKLHIDNLALDSIGNHLYTTYYDKSIFNRHHNVGLYEETLKELSRQKSVSLYKPNAYLWQYTDHYFDIPMYNSQVNLFDDTVPFLPIVLKGYIDYYSPFVNFFSNPNEQLLIMIDYGIYPSYIVTHEPTHQMSYTNANVFFSTEYSTWEEKILDQYTFISEALNQVNGEEIVSRVVVDVGVVEVTYSNDVKFIINYSDSDYIYQEKLVKAKGYLSMGGGYQ